MTIFIFIITLAILILSHEFGHFLAAKKSGIQVDEFAFGFPPRLFKWKKGETTYSINLFPIGGYVKIKGEDSSEEETEEKNDPKSFISKPAYIKAAVLAAGVFFNLVLAWILLSVGYITGLPSSTSAIPLSAGVQISERKIIVVDVAKNSPAEMVGIKMGDEILGFSQMQDVQNFISTNRGKEINLDLIRNGEKISVSAIPREDYPYEEGSLGIAMDEVGLIKIPWYKAPIYGAKLVFEITILVIKTFYEFIIGIIKGVAGIEQLTGPVGIFKATGTASKMGFSYLLSFISLVSINLAVINFLPFPALDGGRILFLIIEKIKGSPLSARFHSIVNSIGFSLLLALMAIVTYRDIIRLIS